MEHRRKEGKMHVSDEQRALLKAALAINAKTTDPLVNFMVDNHNDDAFYPYNEDEYLEEIAAWKKSNGFLLSYSNASIFY
jgi:hypothetical protein